ncbi:MAG TPA: CvpA family protein [Methylophilaceae bacterium]|jgi:membrane protein required for colicin V production
MTIFDYAVLGIVGISVFVSLIRGFIREFLALVSWVAAFVVARAYTTEIVPLLPADIPSEALRYLAAFIILFLATLLISSLLSIALSQLLKSLKLGWLNRVLGGLFGILRGVCVVSILVFLAGFTNIPKDDRWQSAMFSSPLEVLVMHFLVWMPEDIAKHVKYD